MQDKYSTGIKDLEVLSNMVYDSQVKDLIKEAIDCYNIGSYRASINLIWTSISLDAFKKVKSLKDIYQEGACEEILNEIKNKEKANKSWEVYIICQLQKKLHTISKLEEERLLFIYKLRNHCSHPILYDNEENFFVPTAESVRYCLRDSIEILLSKPLLFGKNSIDLIFSEISGSYFPRDYEKFREVFIEKFLKKTVSDKVTKNLVMICLKNCFLDADLSNPNITDEIYLNVLNTIWNYDKTKNIFVEFKEDIIKKLEQVKDDKVSNLINFLCLNGNKSNIINGNTVIESKISEFVKGNNNLKPGVIEALFISGNVIDENVLKEHFKILYFTHIENINYLFKNSNQNIIKFFFSTIFYEIECSSSYMKADTTISYCLIFFSYISEKNILEKLINSIISNKNKYEINQILESNQACINLKNILDKINLEFLQENKDLIQKLINEVIRLNKKNKTYFLNFFIREFNIHLIPILSEIGVDISNLEYSELQ